jgi:Tetratricopeptide repeat
MDRTTRDISNLGSVFQDLGDLEGARHLHERALAIREARLGPDHPDTATTQRSLTNLRHELAAQDQLAHTAAADGS